MNKPAKKSKYYFYILRCKDKTLYSGMTNDLTKRELVHNSGKGSKYVFARGGGKIVYSETFRSKSKAMRREAEVKRWPRLKKLTLLKQAHLTAGKFRQFVL